MYVLNKARYIGCIILTFMISGCVTNKNVTDGKKEQVVQGADLRTVKIYGEDFLVDDEQYNKLYKKHKYTSFSVYKRKDFDIRLTKEDDNSANINSSNPPLYVFSFNKPTKVHSIVISAEKASVSKTADMSGYINLDYVVKGFISSTIDTIVRKPIEVITDKKTTVPLVEKYKYFPKSILIGKDDDTEGDNVELTLEEVDKKGYVVIERPFGGNSIKQAVVQIVSLYVEMSSDKKKHFFMPNDIFVITENKDELYKLLTERLVISKDIRKNEQMIERMYIEDRDIFMKLRKDNINIMLPKYSMLYAPSDADFEYIIRNKQDYEENGRYMSMRGKIQKVKQNKRDTSTPVDTSTLALPKSEKSLAKPILSTGENFNNGDLIDLSK